VSWLPWKARIWAGSCPGAFCSRVECTSVARGLLERARPALLSTFATASNTARRRLLNRWISSCDTPTISNPCRAGRTSQPKAFTRLASSFRYTPATNALRSHMSCTGSAFLRLSVASQVSLKSTQWMCSCGSREVEVPWVT